MINLEELLGENLLKSPPDFTMAANHHKAQIINKEILRDSERCPCCNLFIQTIKYPISTNLNVFSQYGRSYKYFIFVKLCLIILNIQFIICGIYNLIQNYKGDQCIKSKTCKKNLNNYLSQANRFVPENYEEDYILDILYIISMVAQLVIIRLIYPCVNDVEDLDSEEKKIQRCSFKIDNDHFNSDYIQNGIVDICYIYDINHLKNNLKSDIIRIIQKDNTKSLKDIVREKVNQFNVYLNRNRYLKVYDDVFVTLSDYKEAIKFQKESIHITRYCPKPSDAIWQYSFSCYKIIHTIIIFLIAFGGWYPILQIEQVKNDYNFGNAQDQININTILSLLAALISFICYQCSLYSLEVLGTLFALSSQTMRKFSDLLLLKLKSWKYEEFIKVCVAYLFYYMLPTLSKFNFKEGDKQEKFWISGGFNEDIMMILLLNAIYQMIFSIIDIKYAWQLIKIIYYKYINKQSNLTQFEANKLYLKKIDFHQKSIQLFILVSLCSLLGCLFPICYPLTIILILIIYWLNKYQLVHNGSHQKIKFKRKLNKIIILLIFWNQYIWILSPYIFDPLNLAFQLVISIIVICKRHWIFPKRIQTHETNIDIINSTQCNYLYSQYNPILNGNILSNVSDDEIFQTILEKYTQCRFTRQEQFYNALQVKLLREIEKTLVSRAQIQPISSAQVQSISNDEDEISVEDQSDKSEQITDIKQILDKSTVKQYFIIELNKLYTRLFKQKQARFYLTITKVEFMKLLELIRNWLNYIHLNQIYELDEIYDILLKSVTTITIDGKDKINLASQLSDIPLWTQIDTWIELFFFIRVNKIDEKKKQAQSIMEGCFFIEQELHDKIKKKKNDLILDEINLFITSLQLPTELSTEIIIKIAQKCNHQISIYHLVKLLKQQEQFPNTQQQKLFKSSKEMLTHKSQKYQKKQLNIYENKMIQGCVACLKFLSIHDQPQKLLTVNRNFNNQLKHKIKKFYMGNYQVFSEESTHQLRLRLMSQALKLKQFNIDYFEMKTNVEIEIGVNDRNRNNIQRDENSIDYDKFISDFQIHDDIELILDIHEDQIQLEELFSILRIYTQYNQDVKYCLSMTYIAGYLYFTFEDQKIAYKIFDRMMNLYFKELYINDYSKLKTELFIFERLFSIFLPELSSYLIHQKIDISYCVATWLSTLFSDVFHHNYRSAFLNVIWDLFLAEEWKGFYKVIFFIFSLIQQHILNLEIQEIHHYLIYLMKSELFSIRTEKELIQYIQTFDESIKEDVSIKKYILLRFRITNRMLMSLQFEYYNFKLKQEKKLNQYLKR